MNSVRYKLRRLLHEDEGAQVVEYALIIAVVSIALVLALGNATTGIGSQFAAFVTRIGTCITTGSC